MYTYITIFFASCLTLTHLIFSQEKEVPTLRSLAIYKAAENLYQELQQMQSPAERQLILDEWEDNLGIMFKHHTFDHEIKIATGNPKNESILERFEQRYAYLSEIAEFDDAFQMCALVNDGPKCCYIDKDRITWTLADTVSGKKLLKFKGHTGWVLDLALASKKKQALSASDDKTLKLWDLKTGKCLRTFEGHTGWVNYVTLAFEGTKALSASWDHTLKLWNLNTGECIHTLRGHTEDINNIAITSDNSKALSASDDHTLKLWNLETGDCMQTLTGHTWIVNHVTLASDDTQALSSSGDNTLKLWDINTGQCLHTLKGHTHWVRKAFFINNDSKALSVSRDMTLKLWDINTGTCLHTFEGTYRRHNTRSSYLQSCKCSFS